MNLAQRLELWGDRHHPKWLDIVRIVLGIFLCFKGIQFLQNMSSLLNMMTNSLSFNAFVLIMLSHYVVFAHLLGGVLLVLGLLTRLACLIQIPVLLGAIFFVNSSGGYFKPFSELLLSVAVLLLLILFLIIGNGPWSFEWFVERDKEKR
jgi:putative oxidoreductase